MNLRLSDLRALQSLADRGGERIYLRGEGQQFGRLQRLGLIERAGLAYTVRLTKKGWAELVTSAPAPPAF